MTTERDDDFAERIVRSLDDSVPEDIADRLAQARARALADAEPAEVRPPMAWRSFALAAGVGALAVSLSFAALRDAQQLGPDGRDAAELAGSLLEGVEPALAEDIDLLEDLEFVAWLEAESLLDAG